MKTKQLFLTVFLINFFFIQINAQKKEKDTIKDDIDHRFYVKNLAINNKYFNFGTTFYGEDEIVYSSQDGKNDTYDLYIGKIADDGEVINPRKIESINSKSFESNVAFTKDQTAVYFTRSMYGKTNTVKKNKDRKATIAIFRADIVGGKWKNIQPMPFNNKEYSVGHPTLSADNSKLFFTSDMPGGFGGTDIYFVDVLGSGNYSKPENMGKKVNSKYREMFPHIKDNVLYFSSNRPDEGLGGLDIYAVKLYGQGKISDRVHLDPPVNSIADDISYIYNDKLKRGYFSSNRARGKGADDIYSFTETRPLQFDCFQNITGEVVDINKDPLPFVEVTLYDVFDKEVKKIKTGADGKFLFEKVDCSANYKIKAYKNHLGTKEINIVTKERHNSKNHFIIQITDDFIVMKRGKRMLNIFSIYFDYDSSKITGRAAGQLNMIVATMRRYPTMVIELGAHTDSRGGDAYNLKLSNDRAQSTVDYIVNKGEISRDRISGKGYGETRLLNHCDNEHRNKCTKKEHEINRRSEFVITHM
jgi:outer membrane protein OmpA-like peptidoglycan-associated protein